jgi:DNA-binding MarR family transcriptional regulator
MAALIVEGDLDGIYGIKARDRRDKSARNNQGHAITAALAAGAARAGWTYRNFEDAILYSPSVGGRHARTILDRKSYREAGPYLERVWARAANLITESSISDRQDIAAELIALREKFTSIGWKGTAGNTALRVLMAFWEAAYKAGGRTFTLSYREAAEIAGCTAHTAYKAVNKRLKRWLRLMQPGEGNTGSTWYFMNGSHERHTPKGAQPPPAQSNVSTMRNAELDAGIIARLMGHDAFAHRGLGMSALKLLAALGARDGQTVKELIESACVSQATVYRVTKVLAGHELVEKVGEIWQLTEEAQKALSGAWDGWDEVADRVGTLGTGERRQALHKAQREAWINITLPRLRQRRMPDVVPIRGDEVQRGCSWGGEAFDPRTGEVMSDLVVASDGRFLFLGSEPEPDYDELLRRNALACAA